MSNINNDAFSHIKTQSLYFSVQVMHASDHRRLSSDGAVVCLRCRNERKKAGDQLHTKRISYVTADNCRGKAHSWQDSHLKELKESEFEHSI